MPVTEKRIANFEFLDLRGAPNLFETEIEVITRPNLDGTILRELGKRGRPFTLNSVVDVIDVHDGRTVANDYRDLVGGGPVELVWHDYDFEVFDSKQIVVLRVEIASIRSIGAIAGAIRPQSPTASEAILRCVWNLLFTEFT